MFSSKGLFKDIICPKLDYCTLPNCIFSHPESSSPTPNSPAEAYDPFAAGTTSSPPAKRRRLDGSAANRRDVERSQSSRDSSTDIPIHSTAALLSRKSIAADRPEADYKAATLPSKSGTKAQDQDKAATTRLFSQERPVSPPPIKTRAVVPSTISDEPSKKPLEATNSETLTPRSVPKAPCLTKTRTAVLQILHQQLVIQNKKIAAAGEKSRLYSLTEQELIKFARNIEEEAALRYDESEMYRNQITQQITKIKKMSDEQWKSFVEEGMRKQVETATKPKDQPNDKLSTTPGTRLSSAEEDLAVLRSLRTSLVGLENYGYVTKQPTTIEIASAKAAVDASAGWEVCDRCDTRFQVFPGRDEQGRLTTEGSCRYHWARSSRSAPHKTDRVNGRAASAYPCCNQPMGSAGCTEAESHVFKINDKRRLASIWQFENTPANDRSTKTPMSFDCEMGYTTLGMEVIRVTAVSWPDGKDVLDVLVRPYGEVLDFNTRFSGVSKKQFMEAKPYAADADVTSEDDQRLLRKVESPAAARQLLFDILRPDTPLIGHAIDNDLNVVRIIHPMIIDTVLLYPHPKGLPIRHGLKVLASKHLDRHIQASDAAGHDSKEDAVATGDLVTKAVANKWMKLKRDGWTFEGDTLVAPQVIKKTPSSKAVL